MLMLLASLSLSAGASDETALPERTPEIWPEIKSRVPHDPSIESRIDEIMSQMSLEQKAGQMIQAEIQNVTPGDVGKYHLGSVLNGGGSWPSKRKKATVADWVELADAFYDASMDPAGDGPAIPVLWGTDAVHGHNNVLGATLFPHNIGLGASWNPELIHDIGEATAREVAATGIKWVFAPTLAAARNDRWGRTYESYSEDPTIIYNYAGRAVEGLQGQPGSVQWLGQDRVIATAKHFIGDGGTLNGKDQGDTWSTEKALMVLHGQGYFSAIEAGVQTIMVSFSSWQGEKLHGHRYLLTEVLKDRMGFDGLLVSDWDAIAGAPEAGRPGVPGCTKSKCPAAVNAGIDLFMAPTHWKDLRRNIIKEARSGDIPMARIDDAVRRILRVKLRAGLFDDGKPSAQPLAGRTELIGAAEHRALAREAVRQSLVLLKNEQGLLPLAADSHVLVAGDGADNIPKQAGGWSLTWQNRGADNEDFPGATSIYTGIRDHLAAAGGSSELDIDGKFTKRPDVAIVVFGEDPYAEFEGDLADLSYSGRKSRDLELMKSLRAQGIPVVSIFLTGRPLWIDPELEASDAFLVAWLPGSEGQGVADVLIRSVDGTIRHDFSGRLTFSWPAQPDQALLNRHDPEYEPRFPYGYGLNYSNTARESQQ